MITHIFTTTSTAGAAVMQPGTRGCPLCARVVEDPATAEGTFVYDARGRYWCLPCVGQALAEITRKDEVRPTAHYRWEIDGNLAADERRVLEGMLLGLEYGGGPNGQIAGAAIRRWLTSAATRPFALRDANTQPTQREIRDARALIKPIDLPRDMRQAKLDVCLQQADNCKAADCPEHGIFTSTERTKK